MTTRLLLALIVLVAAAACSDEGGLSDEEQAFADAFSATLQDDEDGLGVPEEDADCMGTAVMEELGAEPFEEAGVTADEIEPGGDKTSPGEILGDDAVSQEQADSIIDVWQADCLDIVDALMESAGSELDLDEEGQDCLEEGLREDELAQRLLAGSFTAADGTPDDESFDAFVELLESCGADTGA